MCIGNRGGGDDAIGPYIADRLKEESEGLIVLDCGVVPENFTSIIKKHSPKDLIIVDAVEMNLEPGEICIVPKEKIGVMHISTHGIPLSVLINYLGQYVKNIILIGIQPKTMSDKMTVIVKESGDRLAELIKNNQLDEIKIFE